MEQYLLQLPKKLATEVRKCIANGDKSSNKIEMISGGPSCVCLCSVFLMCCFLGFGDEKNLMFEWNVQLIINI